MTKQRLAEMQQQAAAGSNRSRLIVDFCVEDVQKVQVLKEREERLRASREVAARVGHGSGKRALERMAQEKYGDTSAAKGKRKGRDRDGSSGGEGDGKDDDAAAGFDTVVDHDHNDDEDGSGGESGADSNVAEQRRAKVEERAERVALKKNKRKAADARRRAKVARRGK